MAVLAYGFGALGALVFLDSVLLDLGLSGLLPWFTAPAAAFAGFLIAVVWYFDIKAKQRAKKKRKKALAAMCVDLGVCILAVGRTVLEMVKMII